MSNVNLMCEKSFSEADQKIVDRLMELQQALIEGDLDKLDGMILDVDDFINVIGKYQSKSEFISQIRDDTLTYSNFDILNPTVLFDGDNSASLIANIRMSVEINGKELRVISNSVVGFEKIDGKWNICKWEN
ncbi:nuclear transport factor 2 family protein [uncultured Methanobrevibacter sp.]|uniref:nuclear transport factor 2 family protein n=1 Tax=uncultured Methanobrevibacter sp. TaxID=253161 RepID=UPI0025DABD72|nr:nuclear transport factor 2 family protein [uncultured Methanobrevibacter sp.]